VHGTRGPPFQIFPSGAVPICRGGRAAAAAFVLSFFLSSSKIIFIGFHAPLRGLFKQGHCGPGPGGDCCPLNPGGVPPFPQPPFVLLFPFPLPAARDAVWRSPKRQRNTGRCTASLSLPHSDGSLTTSGQRERVRGAQPLLRRRGAPSSVASSQSRQVNQPPIQRARGRHVLFPYPPCRFLLRLSSSLSSYKPFWSGPSSLLCDAVPCSNPHTHPLTIIPAHNTQNSPLFLSTSYVTASHALVAQRADKCSVAVAAALGLAARSLCCVQPLAQDRAEHEHAHAHPGAAVGPIANRADMWGRGSRSDAEEK
jgi:hypothetical protein